MRKISLFILMFSILGYTSIAQQVSLTGKVINPDEKPIKNVFIYLKNNPKLSCYSDSLGNFSLIDQISTSVTEIRQDKIISFENRKLSLYANNQSISVDVITIDGRLIMNIVNQNKSIGTIELYPESYISGLPQAIYILRARVGSTFQSFKIQNLIPSGFSQGITQYNINDTIDNSFSEPESETKSETKSGVQDTLVLVHDFYKSRKIPLDSYSIHYDSIHLNNFAEYSIAEGFEPSITYLYNGYANFTNILTAGSAQFIIDYDTLAILEGDLKVITIPIDKIESLDKSVTFISGLHFEPSETKFIQPVKVTLLLKDSIPKNLVIFQCNNKGETYFIPYISDYLGLGRYYIIFNINHFSSIGIGTGEIPATNPAEFTTSDQFLSYLAKCVANNEEVTEAFFDTWYNNIIAPMINNINTLDDLIEALNEILIIQRTNDLLGLNDQAFLDQAMKIISDKMKKIWNELIVEYNGLEDYCLKLEILNIALQMCKISDLVGNLYQPDIDAFGNGDISNLAYGIEYSTPVKHLEIGESYVVEYTLKCLSGNCLPPPIIFWYSRNPRVAEINYEGKIVGLSEGVTIVKGKICDEEFTFKVEVGEYACEWGHCHNCEDDYCINYYDSCYSGRYECTSVGTKIISSNQCGVYSITERITIVGNLENSGLPDYHEVITTSENHYYNSYVDACQLSYSLSIYDGSGGEFRCQRIAYFQFLPWFMAQNQFYCTLIGDHLDCEIKPGFYIATKMQCRRIDK